MIRIAAVGDVHAGLDCQGRLRDGFRHLSERADVLLLAGDLTRCGHPEEAAVLAGELRGVGVPVVAVLGNHDYHSDASDEVVDVMEEAGAHVLEGGSVTIDVNGVVLGVGGAKGFGHGFAGRCASEFGEPEMKAFVAHARDAANSLERALLSASQTADVLVSLTHYSPVPDTLQGEPPEIHPFLGSYLLGEAIDRVCAHLAIHGHAHRGMERGVTPGGVRVRNVAQPVIRRSYQVYVLHPERLHDLHEEELAHT